MEFKRKKKRGISQKVKKIWLSREGYRIVWRREVYGVSVPAAYQVCVRTIVPGNFPDGKTIMWDFVNRNRRLHKTMKAAVAECENHFRLWSKAIECTGIRALCELMGFYPSCVPQWFAGKLNRRVLTTILDTTPHRKGHEDEEEESEPASKSAPEPQLEQPEQPKKRRTRSDKGKPRKIKTEPAAEKPKRKQRSDKGKKRGPRKPKGMT